MRRLNNIKITKDIINLEVEQITQLVKRILFDFILLIFTLRASRRLSSAALLRARHRVTIALPLSALHMKASDSCKIQVLMSSLLFRHGFTARFARDRRGKIHNDITKI